MLKVVANKRYLVSKKRQNEHSPSTKVLAFHC